VALEGDLKLFSLPDILQVVSQQQKTGILTIQGEQDILAVSFLAGEIVAADALNQNFEDGLGEVLAMQGWLQPEVFARLAEEHRKSGERFSEFLVGRGVLTREQLLQALRVQTYRLLLQVLRWREGEFKFYSGEEVSFEEGMPPISVEEVLMRSVGDLVGEGTLSGALPHGFVAYERLPNGRPLRVGTRDAEGLRDGSAIWVTPDEKVVLDRLDGRAVADEIARRSGLGEYKTLYALYRLIQQGLARPAGDPEAGNAESPVFAPQAPSPAPARKITPVPAAGAARRLSPAPESRVETTRTLPRPSESFEAAWILAMAAVVAGILIVGIAFLRPPALQLPFPGQADTRAALEQQRRVGRYLAIDRAARTFYLLEGRYPDRLEELVGRELVAERTAADPSGRPLELAAHEDTYQLRPVENGVPVADQGITESVAGDFLLDPAFFAGLVEESGVPLVLLD
jgi:hypothetical protein